MTTIYKPYCSLQVGHDFYSSGKSADFDLVPTSTTVRSLMDHQMLIKMSGDQLLIFIKVKGTEYGPDAGKPFVQPGKELVLSFYMILKRPGFFNFTNLDFEPSSGKRYYFSNAVSNEHDGALYLTRKIPNYGGGNYLPGDLAEGSLGVVYEALQANSASAHPTGETTFWFNKGKRQFVTQADSLKFSGSIINLEVTAAKDFSIDVMTLNSVSGNYDQSILHQERKFDEDQTRLQLDLNGYSPGFYKVVINGVETGIYLDERMLANNAFGVIDIFHHHDAAHKYSLFDASGNLLNPTYLIHFANRQGYWKYHLHSHGNSLKTITDAVGTYHFVQSPALPDPNPEFFISDLPIPVRQTPFNFQMDIPDISGDVKPSAPNPDPFNNQSITKTGHDYTFNIHLNL